ncbi:hypothetical protein NDNC_0240 [Candidatus Nasuia deltocephalinicola]|uniref:Uncharacterized protein n=1 Tax=Candidatus Nasuia deltocephalincola TaxID=1160784 RepID=A0A974WLF7_9PROT|nr:hypothetical protein CU086_00590 [Candidatus Nasuia deltocephalinicola]BEH03858.1 hypothetical protein NDNC_0240 [Candidatus Nasuia deltocephalinicola]
MLFKLTSFTKKINFSLKLTNILNIFKNILIIYIIIIIIKKNIFKNTKKNKKNKKNLIKIKNKKIKIYKSKTSLIYFGYILCSNKCPKIIKKINKNLKNKKKSFFFISINQKENSYIIEKIISNIKKCNVYGLIKNKKNLKKISKEFKIIYKYKNNKINHTNLIYKINFKKNLFKIKNEN